MSMSSEILFVLSLDSGFMISGSEVFSGDYQPVKELKGMSFPYFLHIDYKGCVISAIEALEDGGIHCEDILLGKLDGRYHCLNLTAEKKRQNTVLSFRRYTGMREPRVSADNDALAGLAQNLSGVFYRTDKHGNILYLSRRISDLIGFSTEELIGGNLRREYFLNPDRYDLVKKSMMNDGALNNTEIAIKNSEGKIVWLNVNSVAVYAENGEYAGTAGFVKNITDVKNSMEELAHMRRLLELKQKELDSLTVSMKYKVQSQVSRGRKVEESILYHARLAEMGEMVGSIAHQWRQPLSALMFIIEDIRDAYHFGELDLNYLDDAIDESMSYIRFMSDTMDDFRNFFRPEPEKEQFNLLDRLVEVVKMQYGRFEVGAVNVLITCDLSGIGGLKQDIIFIEYGRGIKIFGKETKTDSGIIAYGYPNLFKQVIINLLNNSIDAIMEKRADGALGATEAGRINIDVRLDGRRIYLTMEDNGTGIKEDSLARIFEPEYTTKPKNKGTGIGLHMAKSIVEKSLGGKIRAGNGFMGALFTVELPRVAVAVLEK